MRTFLSPKSDGDADYQALQRVSMFQEALQRLEVLEQELRPLHDWLPGKRLHAEAQWCRSRAEELEERIQQKLLVALVGPSGSGKSTLLNAIAGADISESGMNRPTTVAVKAYAQEVADAEELTRHCGSGKVQVHCAQEAPWLDQIVLVDTPDTNTTPENRELLLKVLEKADIILAVFNAQNPKIHDNIHFLRPIIAEYDAESVIPILNWVDRIEEGQLKNEILPDFQRHIAKEWGWEGKRTFAVSARSSLPDAIFPDGENPLHAYNQFPELREFLLGEMNRAGVRVDLRVGRAMTLADLSEERVRKALRDSAGARFQALQAIEGFEQAILRRLVEHLGNENTTQQKHIGPLLYQDLSKRWWGPTGWLIAFWARILSAKSWTANLLRGNSQRGLVPRMMLGDGTPTAPTDLPAVPEGPVDEEVAKASLVLRQLQHEQWPEVAERLVQAGFTTDSRGWEIGDGITGRTVAVLQEEWLRIYQEQIDESASTLANGVVQFLFNLPVLFLLVWIVAKTIFGFFLEQYLPAAFFRHALITVLLVWGLTFAVFQFFLSMASGDRFLRATRRKFRDSGHFEIPSSPWKEQLQALRRLEARVSGRG